MQKFFRFFCYSLVLFPSTGFAQDAVYLLNGRTIRGQITSIDKHQVNIKVPYPKGNMQSDAESSILSVPEKKIWYVSRNGRAEYPYARINMMNGRVRRLEPTRYDSVLVYYRKPKTLKEKYFREQFVFSYFSEGKEQVVFTPMITDFDTIEVSEARSAFQGKRDARTKYKQPYTALISVLVGAAGGYTLAWYGLIPVTAFAALDGLINPRAGAYRQRRYGEKLVYDPYYRYGFNKQAKLIKLRNDILGGVAGIAAGLGMILYIRNTENP
ncbi:MAG: hypothetical protein N2110_00735 [Flavobacteriales bacterium]|nr:hypothetical protein [Flavobacteriales bacterium]MCX7767536.1 hypothetical protein [Flavobacteriales bacterium]MDW8410391.1 hypothetical protein [Flavobacteriales bacterium]